MSLNVVAADATKVEVKTEKAGATEKKKDAKADFRNAKKGANADYEAASADCKK